MAEKSLIAAVQALTRVGPSPDTEKRLKDFLASKETQLLISIEGNKFSPSAKPSQNGVSIKKFSSSIPITEQNVFDLVEVSQDSKSTYDSIFDRTQNVLLSQAKRQPSQSLQDLLFLAIKDYETSDPSSILISVASLCSNSFNSNELFLAIKSLKKIFTIEKNNNSLATKLSSELIFKFKTSTKVSSLFELGASEVKFDMLNWLHIFLQVRNSFSSTDPSFSQGLDIEIKRTKLFYHMKSSLNLLYLSTQKRKEFVQKVKNFGKNYETSNFKEIRTAYLTEFKPEMSEAIKLVSFSGKETLSSAIEIFKRCSSVYYLHSIDPNEDQFISHFNTFCQRFKEEVSSQLEKQKKDINLMFPIFRKVVEETSKASEFFFLNDMNSFRDQMNEVTALIQTELSFSIEKWYSSITQKKTSDEKFDKTTEGLLLNLQKGEVYRVNTPSDFSQFRYSIEELMKWIEYCKLPETQLIKLLNSLSISMQRNYDLHLTINEVLGRIAEAKKRFKFDASNPLLLKTTEKISKIIQSFSIDKNLVFKNTEKMIEFKNQLCLIAENFEDSVREIEKLQKSIEKIESLSTSNFIFTLQDQKLPIDKTLLDKTPYLKEKLNSILLQWTKQDIEKLENEAEESMKQKQLKVGVDSIDIFLMNIESVVQETVSSGLQSTEGDNYFSLMFPDFKGKITKQVEEAKERLTLKLRQILQTLIENLNRKEKFGVKGLVEEIEVIPLLQGGDISQMYECKEQLTLLREKLIVVSSIQTKMDFEGFRIDLEDLKNSIERILYSRIGEGAELVVSGLAEYCERAEHLYTEQSRLIMNTFSDLQTIDRSILRSNLTKFLSIDKDRSALSDLQEFMSVFFPEVHLPEFPKSAWVELAFRAEITQAFLRQQTQSEVKALSESLNPVIDQIGAFVSKARKLKKRIQAGPEGELKALSGLAELNSKWNRFIEREKETLGRMLEHGEAFAEACASFQEVEAFALENEKEWKPFFVFQETLTARLNEVWSSFRFKLPELKAFLLQTKEASTRPEVSELRSHQIVADECTRLLEQCEFLTHLRGEDFEPEHWEELRTMLGLTSPRQEWTTGQLIRLDLSGLISPLSELNRRARQQRQVSDAISEAGRFLDSTEFRFKEREGLPMVVDFEPLLLALDEKRAALLGLAGSKFARLGAAAAAQAQRIDGVADCVESLRAAQAKFAALRRLLRGVEPTTLDPAERRRFEVAAGRFEAAVARLAEEKRIGAVLDFDDYREFFPRLTQQFESAERALGNFVEEKRRKTPRFYLLGDAELLDFLGSKNPSSSLDQVVEKMFPGSVGLILSGSQVVGIRSSLGEKLSISPLEGTDSEGLIGRLDAGIKSGLQALLVAEGGARRGSQAIKVEQISVLMNWIRFFAELEGGRPANELASEVEENLGGLAATKGASGLEEAVRRNQVILAVAQRDILGRLEKEGGVGGFYFFSLLKFEWRAGESTTAGTNQSSGVAQKLAPSPGTALCRVGLYSTDYGFEYLGNPERLALTPLTERCFFGLTQALKFGRGGSPQGPAGTGKTETVKALGNSIGRGVLVFNCDEALGIRALAGVLAGISGSGLWACFDEFNRMSPVQLSGAAQLLQALQSAVRRGTTETQASKDGKNSAFSNGVELLGSWAKLHPHSAVFVTLNPAGKNYRGRSPLPESLKSLFKVVVMNRPCVSKIAEILFIVEGIPPSLSSQMSKRISALLEQSPLLLPQNSIYDFGLRAVKMLCARTGLLCKKGAPPASALRDALSLCVDSRQTRMEREAWKPLADKAVENLPDKVIRYEGETKQDKVRANIGKIGNDSTPERTSKDPASNQMWKESIISNQAVINVSSKPSGSSTGLSSQSEAIEIDFESSELRTSAFARAGLVENQTQTDLARALWAQLTQRCGAALIGASGVGKSSILTLLRGFLETQGHAVSVFRLAPKAMGKTSLLGRWDDTGEFEHGALVGSLRRAYSDECKAAWFILDGDVDPNWAESLNSLLDDNRLLTAANGERFVFPSRFNVILETEHLEAASPATVSRLGVVLVEHFLAGEESALARLAPPAPRLSRKIEVTRPRPPHRLRVCAHRIVAMPLDQPSFFCNGRSTAKQLFQLLQAHCRRNRDELTPLAGPLTLNVFHLESVDPDEFGQRPFEQTLLELAETGVLHSPSGPCRIRDFQLCFHLSPDSNPCARLSNRLVREDSPARLPPSSIDADSTRLCALLKQRVPKNFQLRLDPELLCSSGTPSSSLKNILSTLLFLALPRAEEQVSPLRPKPAPSALQKALSLYASEKEPLPSQISSLFSSDPSLAHRFLKIKIAVSGNEANHFVFSGRRQSLKSLSVELACLASGVEFFKLTNIPEETRYKTSHFSAELIGLFTRLSNNPVLLFISESQTHNRAFLSDLDSLLNHPLFSAYSQEVRQVLGPSSEPSDAAPLVDRLRVCVALDSQNPSHLDQICESFSFIQRHFCLLLDEVDPRGVATSLGGMLWPGYKKQLEELANSSEPNGLPRPSKILLANSVFEKLKSSKLSEFSAKTQHYKLGVSSLTQAGLTTKTLSEGLKQERASLEEKQEALNKKLEKLSIATANAVEEKLEAEKLEVEASKNRAELEIKKLAIAEQLAKVMPAVEEAKAQVRSLSKQNIDELRNYKFPSEQVIDIFSALLQMCDEYDLSWNNMKKFLAKRTVLSFITELDPAKIRPETLREAEAIVAKKPDSFDFDKVARSSLAAAPIAVYVKAMVRYIRAVHDAEPLEKERDILDKALSQALAKIDTLKSKIASLENQKADLKSQITKFSFEIETSKKEMQIKANLLNRAEDLLGALNEEGKRWNEKLALIPDQNKTETISLALALFVVGGAFKNSKESKEYLDHLLNVFGFKSLGELLVDPYVSMNLVQKGHSDDQMHLLLTILAQSISKIPKVLFDSRNAYLRFIKNDELESKNKENKTDESEEKSITISLEDKNFWLSLDLAVKFGKTIIVSNFEMTNLIRPIFSKLRLGESPNPSLKVRDLVLHESPQFSFIGVTNSACRPKGHCLYFNYDFSIDSALGEVLSLLVEAALPSIEKQRNETQKKLLECRTNLETLESNLLGILANSKQDIINSPDLMNSLMNCKNEVLAQKASLQTQLRIEEEISEKRNVYFPLSKKLAHLFQTAHFLSELDDNYFFELSSSLDQLRRFLSSQKEIQSMSPDEILSKFLPVFLSKVSLAIKNQHRLSFATEVVFSLGLFDRPGQAKTTLASILSPGESKINPNFYTILFSNSLPLRHSKLDSKEVKDISVPPLFRTVPMELCVKVNRAMPGLFEQMKEIQTAEELESKLGEFAVLEKLLLCRLFLPHLMFGILSEYVKSKIGPWALLPGFDIDSVLGELSTSKPLLLYFDSFMNPIKSVIAGVEKLFPGSKVEEYIVGQNSSEFAAQFLQSKVSSDSVLILQNVQLDPELCSLIPVLLARPEKLRMRLILTAEPNSNLSRPLLHLVNSVRIQRSPSLLKSFESNQLAAQNSDNQTPVISKVSLIHAVSDCRIIFRPRGFHSNYDFSSDDLTLVKELVLACPKNFRPVNLKKYISEFIYESRIVNQFDSAIVVALFEKFCGESQHPLLDSLLQAKQEVNNTDPTLLGLDSSVAGGLAASKYSSLRADLALICPRLRPEVASSKTGALESPATVESLKAIKGNLVSLAQKLNEYPSSFTGSKESNMFEHFLRREKGICSQLCQVFMKVCGSIDKFLEKKSSQEGLQLVSNLLRNKTPEEISSVWTHSSDLSAYLAQLSKIASSIIRSVESVMSRRSMVDLSLMFSPLSFLEYFRWIESKADSDLRFFFTQKTSSLSIEKIFFEGAEISNGTLDFTAPRTSLKNKPISLSLNLSENGPKEEGKIEFEIPVYLNSHRSEKIFSVWFFINEKMHDELVLKSPAFYLFDLSTEIDI